MDGAELQGFVDRYNAAWGAHDVDAIVAMHTEDSVFENHVSGDVNVGRKEIAKAIAGIFGVFPDLTFETAAPTSVKTWSSRSGRRAAPAGTMMRSGMEVPPTGKKVEYRGMDVIPIRDGLVAREDVYSDSVTLLRQLGLTEIG